MAGKQEDRRWSTAMIVLFSLGLAVGIFWVPLIGAIFAATNWKLDPWLLSWAPRGTVLFITAFGTAWFYLDDLIAASRSIWGNRPRSALVGMAGLGLLALFFVQWFIGWGSNEMNIAVPTILGAILIASVAAGLNKLKEPPPAQQRPEDATEIANLRAQLAEERTKPKAVPVSITKPELNLLTFSIYTFPQESGPFPGGLAIGAKIWKTGSPTILTKWMLSVVLEGGQSFQAIGSTAKYSTIGTIGDPGSVIVTEENNLILVTEKKEIALRPTEGYFIFFYPPSHATRDEEIKDLVLTASDVHGVDTTFHLSPRDMPRISGTPKNPPTAAPDSQSPSGTEQEKQP